MQLLWLASCHLRAGFTATSQEIHHENPRDFGCVLKPVITKQAACKPMKNSLQAACSSQIEVLGFRRAVGFPSLFVPQGV